MVRILLANFFSGFRFQIYLNDYSSHVRITDLLICGWFYYGCLRQMQPYFSLRLYGRNYVNPLSHKFYESTPIELMWVTLIGIDWSAEKVVVPFPTLQFEKQARNIKNENKTLLSNMFPQDFSQVRIFFSNTSS